MQSATSSSTNTLFTKKNSKQTTLSKTPPVKIRNQKRMYRGGISFWPVSDHTYEGIIEETEKVHHRTKFYALFSGGKDSMTVTHKLAEMNKLEKVVHIKTNIGLKMSVDFVKDICQEYGWPLQIVEPVPKFTYASQALEFGFPGPETHRFIMAYLKFTTMRDFAMTASKKHHVLVSGIRKFESQRRFGKYPHPIQKHGSLWFTSPIFYYSTEETYRYVHENGLKISPAYDLGLGVSGECLCGAYASKGEKMRIKELDPHLAEYIEWLEDGIQRFGTPMAKKYGKWGMQAKISEIDQQTQLTGFMAKNPELVKNLNLLENTVCGVECGPGTLRGDTDYG